MNKNLFQTNFDQKLTKTLRNMNNSLREKMLFKMWFVKSNYYMLEAKIFNQK